MINLFWCLVAKLLARPAIADWLITRAQRTPYLHIMSADGTEMYMGRWWLFNPYSRETHKPALWWFPWSFRKQCRDRVLSQHLVHHAQASGRAKAGQPLVLDTLSSAFAEARDKAGAKLGITFGRQPPSFHEQRSLAARLHEVEGRDAQKLLGHRSATMTDLYRDSRGAEWIDVA